MKTLKTINLSGSNYAKVSERIKEFRAENPNGLIETEPTITDTHIIFKARILKDKSNPASAEATGHSFGLIERKDKKGNDVEKVFEKQETIAVGRALALLGYGADGEIASSEEMEEFLVFQQEKQAEQIMEVSEAIGNCATLDEMKKYWASLSGEMKKLVEEIKEAKKKELESVKETIV